MECRAVLGMVVTSRSCTQTLIIITYENARVDHAQTNRVLDSQVRVHHAVLRISGGHERRAGRVEHRSGVVAHIRCDLLVGRDICKVTELSQNEALPRRGCHEALCGLDCLRDCENIKVRAEIRRVDYGEIEGIARVQRHRATWSNVSKTHTRWEGGRMHVRDDDENRFVAIII